MANDYWKTRQKQLNRWLSQKESKLHRQTVKLYRQEQKRLSAEISKFYADYGVNNIIEYRLLMQQLSPSDVDLLLKKTDDFMAKYPQYAHLAPVRNNIYKLNRLEGLQTSAKIELLNLGAIEQDEVKKHLENVSNKSTETWSTIQGLQIINASYNANLINDIVGARWYAGQNFSDRIWNNKEKLSRTLNTDLKNAFIRGDTYKSVEKVLKHRFDVGTKEAHRLVYTEGTFVMNESKARTFEGYYDTYMYTTMGDDRVCPDCEALDGMVFKFSERIAGENFPPLHPSCRCTFEIADVETY